MGRSDDKKRPKWDTDPSPTKQAKNESVEDWREKPVLWSFAAFDNVDWRNAHERNKDDLFCETLMHLKSCEGRTWKQIEADRGRDHSVEVHKLTAEARKRLEEIKQGDIDSLWRLRFEGRLRIWGIRDRRVLKVIWWDPHHRICPSAKRHT